jgi:Uma2 family endonuclease
MTTVIEESTDSPPTTALRPVLPEGRMQIQLEEPLSDAEFWAFCQQNDGLTIEQNPDGTIVIMPPTGGTSGNRNFHINLHLARWIEDKGSGFGFDSNTMFRLPNGAKRMPDASWIEEERYRALTQEERDGIVPLAPDFVVELRSPTDALDTLKNKMNEYVRAGVRLGWLIDPQTETVTMYQDDASPETLDRPDAVKTDTVVPNFTLPMGRIWDPLGDSDA